MNYELRKTEYPGGGWIVKATPVVRAVTDEAIRPTLYSFRTLDAARRFIAHNSNVVKRVRLTKVKDTHYTYKA